MANWGVGIGAFANGLASGVSIGRTVNTAKRRQKKEQAFGSVMGDAREDYSAMIQDKVKAQAAKVPGTGFDPKKYATKIKTKNSFSDYFFDTKLPSAVTSLMEAGDFETAKALRSWGESRDSKQYLSNFGEMINASSYGQSTGDYTDYFSTVKTLVNDGDFGANITHYSPLRDGKGNVTGVEFKYKDADDGKTYKRSFSDLNALTQHTAGMLSPSNVAAAQIAKQAAATKAKAGIAETAGKERLKLNSDLVRERLGYRHDRALNVQEAGLKAGRKTGELQGQTRYKVQALKNAGFSDERINALMPQILGLSSTTNTMSPQQQVRTVRQMLSKNSYEFRNANPPQKRQMIEAVIGTNNQISQGMNGAPGIGQQRGRQATGLPLY